MTQVAGQVDGRGLASIDTVHSDSMGSIGVQGGPQLPNPTTDAADVRPNS